MNTLTLTQNARRTLAEILRDKERPDHVPHITWALLLNAELVQMAESLFGSLLDAFPEQMLAFTNAHKADIVLTPYMRYVKEWPTSETEVRG